MKLITFKEEHLPEAAKILALRHRLERKAFPGLAPKFEDPKYALKSLTSSWKKHFTGGIAAFKENKLVGYLIGHVVPNCPYFGRHLRIDYEDLAIAGTEDPELFRYLYAGFAETRLKFGCFNHIATIPAGNPKVIEAWQKLGFSYQQVYGLCELPEIISDYDNKSDLTIKLATESDEEEVRSIADLTLKYQTGAPVWAVGLPEEVPELREGYAELISDKTADLWLAYRDNNLVGFQCFRTKSTGETEMMIPEKSIEIVAAGTIPEERGHGVGSLLTKQGFLRARRKGFRYSITDWRITNLLSSRFWPKQGFRPTAYRLIRQIDSRILWANGQATLLT